MPLGTLPPDFVQQYFDQTGTRPVFAAGYLLEQYIQGTTTDQDTFTDEALTIPNEHPITLDSAGKCTMWLDPANLYTFVLKTPDGAIVDTWDVTPTQLQTAGDFLPLDGSAPMTGLFDLAGPATASLNAVTLQQANDLIATAVSSLTALTDAATAAAASATAAAAAITPTHFSLSSSTGTSMTRSVTLSAGTWEIALLTMAEKDDTGTYSITVTQSATVSTATVSNSFDLVRSGGAGYGRNIYGHGLAVGTLTVATATTYTVTVDAASLGGAVSRGSVLTLQKSA